jgi:hypothetical protein
MTTDRITHLRAAGSTLALVLVLTGCALLVVAGVLSWTASSSRFTQRRNQYRGSVAAAEAATEQVIACLSRDFQRLGESGVFNNLATYRPLLPAGMGVSNGAATTFQFADGQGHVDQTSVDRLTPWEYTLLQTRRPGLRGYASSYRIVSNARELNTSYASVAAVRQEVQIASIPVFQFQLFYASDLELTPGVNDMTVTGPVHCNGTIYCEPDARALTFLAPVTAGRQVLQQKHPADPVIRTPGSVTYNEGREMRVNTLNLPMGTSSTPAVLHSLVDLPPSSELPGSLMGAQRYYNKADLIVLVSNTTVVAKSGLYNGFSVSIPWTNIGEIVFYTQSKGKDWWNRRKRKLNPLVYDGVVSTNVTFFDKRQNKTVKITEIDIGQLLVKYSYLTSVLGREVKTLYVADFRTQTSATQPGVRLVLGETLPAHGLTVATPNPLYLAGDYNVTPGAQGTTNTSQTVPASLVADAITVLSEQWNDTNGGATLSYRPATNTTINAAMLLGIVPTGGGYFSGGLDNCPRLLEDWTGRTLTINGSMVVLYESQIANAPWGAAPDIYNPPIRVFSFDPNFREEGKLPPGTPQLRTLIRSRWSMIRPDSLQ